MALPYQPMDEGVIDFFKGTITYKAIPYPLPEAYVKELQEASAPMIAGRLENDAHYKENPTNSTKLDRILRRLVRMCGVSVTRAYISPFGRNRSDNNSETR